MLWSPTARQWMGPGDRRTDDGRGPGGEGSWVFLFMIEWARQAPWAGLGGKSGFWGGGRRLARTGAPGYQGRERRGARLGIVEVEALPRAMALAQAWGWGAVVAEGTPQHQAWKRPVRAQEDGPGGSLVFGPDDPRTQNTRFPGPPLTQEGHHGVGAGMGVRGHLGSPGLVFLERLNGKRLADGRSPTWLQGAPRR